MLFNFNLVIRYILFNLEFFFILLLEAKHIDFDFSSTKLMQILY